jgi:hypothetical protein
MLRKDNVASDLLSGFSFAKWGKKHLKVLGAFMRKLGVFSYITF